MTGRLAVLGKKLAGYCRAPVLAGGVVSVWSWRFFLVLAAYLGSALCFMHDPFFQKYGQFHYEQGILVLLLAVLLLSACNWELCLFGRPAGGNLLLQIVVMIPGTLFLGRLLGEPAGGTDAGFAGMVIGGLKSVKHAVFGNIDLVPEWLQQLFGNWKMTLILVLCLALLSLPRRNWRLPAVLLVLLVPYGVLVSSGSRLDVFFAGTLLLAAGMTLQFCRCDRIIFLTNVHRQLQSAGAQDALLLETEMRVMAELADGGTMSRARLQGIAAMVYGRVPAASGSSSRLIAGEVARKMVYELRLVRLTADDGGGGLGLQACRGLFGSGSMLRPMAELPRAAVMAATALLWVLLPLDLIPDAVPFFGCLDDVAAVLLTCLSLRGIYRRDR